MRRSGSCISAPLNHDSPCVQLAGIVGMCKEHLGVALALKVPVFFVVTKVDICPGHVLQHSLATLSSILRKPGIKKKPYMVRSVLPEWQCPASDRSASLGEVILGCRLSVQPLVETQLGDSAAGQEQGGCLDMRASHTHRLACACVPDVIRNR